VKRKPAVAYQFYEGKPDRLKHQIEQFIEEGVEKKKAIGLVSPHAGYIYSGNVAGSVFSRAEPAEVYVILGPNHRGVGRNVSIMNSGIWEMPLGDIDIEQEFANRLQKECDLITEDELAHQFEHSLEVQVPFLQYIAPNASIVPICIGMRDLLAAQKIGQALAKTITGYHKTVTVIASTDMSHYEPHEVAKRKDRPALDFIIDRNPKGLYEYVMKYRISMCGVIPTVITLYAAIELGATTAELVRYATSGETSGDYHQVVGYAGFIIYKDKENK
jgi:AmmeMemoRadiSam system protein B